MTATLSMRKKIIAFSKRYSKRLDKTLTINGNQIDNGLKTWLNHGMIEPFQYDQAEERKRINSIFGTLSVAMMFAVQMNLKFLPI